MGVTPVAVTLVAPCWIVTRPAEIVPSAWPEAGAKSTSTVNVAELGCRITSPSAIETIAARGVSSSPTVKEPSVVAPAAPPALSLHAPSATETRPGPNAARPPKANWYVLPLMCVTEVEVALTLEPCVRVTRSAAGDTMPVPDGTNVTRTTRPVAVEIRSPEDGETSTACGASATVTVELVAFQLESTEI